MILFIVAFKFVEHEKENKRYFTLSLINILAFIVEISTKSGSIQIVSFLPYLYSWVRAQEKKLPIRLFSVTKWIYIVLFHMKYY